MNADASTLLPENALVGRNRIRRFLWDTPLGNLYEITIGSTTHEYGLLVLDPTVRPESLDALRTVLAPALAAVNPCLAKPFACGENDGLLWIRMELTESVRLSKFTASSHRGHSKKSVDDLRVEDPIELLEAYEGSLPQRVAIDIFGDLLEGLSAVHKAGGTLGPLSLHDIGFEEWARGSGPHVISKWCNYGLLALRDPQRAQSWTQQDDLAMLSAHFATLLCASTTTSSASATASLPEDAWPEWSTFLATSFSNAAEMDDAFQAILAKHRQYRAPRIRPEDAIAPTASISIPSRHSSSGHSHSHRSHSRKAPDRGKRAAFTIGLIAAIGIVAIILLPTILKSIQNPNGPDTPTASTEASSEKKPDAKSTAAASDVWDLSLDELKTAAEDEANYPARMRYAFILREGTSNLVADPATAETLATETLAAMDERSIGVNPAFDRACDFWKGYALLVGFGTEADSSSARILLERCEETHRDLYAKSLLADYFASGAEDGHSLKNDEAALERWFALIEETSTPTKLSPMGFECANKIAAFYFAKRAIPERNQDRYIATLESIAKRTHIPTFLALGNIYLEGKITNLNEAAAKQWFGDAAQRGSPEGMYHMAWMLERGIASTPSDRAAAIWYRRAASAGDADSMRALARLLRDKRIKNDAGEVLTVEGGKTADEWEAAIGTDSKPHAELPYTTWWLGAQANRFQAPEPATVR